LAKVAELLDRSVFGATGFASGHNLKHVLAALGTLAILWMLVRRRAAAEAPATSSA